MATYFFLNDEQIVSTKISKKIPTVIAVSECFSKAVKKSFMLLWFLLLLIG